jgi:adenylosuccinate lyase
MITNVLAQRYASPEICDIWSGEGKVKLERDFWIAILKAQKELGLAIPQEAIDAYESVRDQVNLASIEAREKVTRHDVKARIEEFCDLAGHEHIHKGLTSRDLTENVEQLQVYKSLQVIREKAVTALIRLSERAKEHEALVITGRTHNVAAQSTSFGKRLAMFGEEFLYGIENLNFVIEQYPVRGLKGAVGTQLDQLTLFEGNTDLVEKLESSVVRHLGMSRKMDAVGQVYGRSLDFQTVSALIQLGAAPSSFAKTLRLMAGHELASEGFAKGQVGSSAMPHKMNSRSCERLNGFQTILGGYLNMLNGLAGDQWNEGDVSCSVVRRVALPDSFFAIDGLLETLLTILKQLEVFPAVIEKENQHYLPFLLTTTIMMEAVKNGAGRESAHEAIKEHAVQTVLDLRNGKIQTNDLLDRLAKDKRLGLSQSALQKIFDEKAGEIGTAPEQIKSFCEKVSAWDAKFPKARTYQPGAIL